jgi:hypothetical protein
MFRAPRHRRACRELSPHQHTAAPANRRKKKKKNKNNKDRTDLFVGRSGCESEQSHFREEFFSGEIVGEKKRRVGCRKGFKLCHTSLNNNLKQLMHESELY